MIINIYSIMFLINKHVFNERERASSQPSTPFEDIPEVSTSEGEPSYAKGLWMSFINEDLPLSEEYVNDAKNNFFFRIVMRDNSLHTFKNILLYLFSWIHLFTYASVLLLAGWYFEITEIYRAGWTILFFLFISLLTCFVQYDPFCIF
ncbi:hypothetical protein NGRA_2152 [Nosema granulosis]|uniref:Uncharacterized protein n=1 Tax=Nosema granulosis TaxID=83296 RepID=A0A9P6GX78_9MICR|nr:hypothetical protein NGRA_2152 [Nosema granulosis]